MMSDEKTTLEITRAGKIIAGILLASFTTAAVILLMAYWPNRMPSVQDGDNGAWYTNTPFNLSLMDVDSSRAHVNDSNTKKNALIDLNIKKLNDSIGGYSKDTTKKSAAIIQQLKDSIAVLSGQKTQAPPRSAEPVTNNIRGRIHLNTILLILVALMGFLGCMVHISTSFTTFVGNETFKKSWVLWYSVKPFTASALAIIVYFIIRAGFLNYASGASGISLYGILAISAMTGLFTDIATMKLKEVFEVLFKPKDERDDKLNGPIINSVNPLKIPAAVETLITLAGKNLNKGVVITIDGNAVGNVVASAEKIELKYKPTEANAAAGKITLLAVDQSGGKLKEQIITIQ